MSKPSSVLYVGSNVGEEINCCICNERFCPQSSENANLKICSDCEYNINSNEIEISDDGDRESVLSHESSDEGENNVSRCLNYIYRIQDRIQV